MGGSCCSTAPGMMRWRRSVSWPSSAMTCAWTCRARCRRTGSWSFSTPCPGSTSASQISTTP
ncbi:hypothetical protein EVA_18080 [gut metagenome]|uniref:Uncharacterized protein n=1 Tax=gut metagenome TaxID=749906 RepID=J9FFW3_9ZZZZ